MSAYYNEIDPYAAAWLRNLIRDGHIADGVVDERSISDVKPEELYEFTQCHFFAGIGVWSRALRQSGWEDDRPVWTGSCPCQPFSGAGTRKGMADERHLWPHWFHLIEECRPSTVFGEQVASKDGLGWIDLVQADMEGADYALGAFDLCSASFGAPHIRQRLWFVADTDNPRSQGWISGGSDTQRQDQHGHVGCDSATDGMDNAISDGRHEGRFGDHGRNDGEQSDPDVEDGRTKPTNGYWSAADWLLCRDGKWRPVRPESFPLAHGATARVGRLRAYGNAITAQVAQGLIESYMEVR
jgi:DNA (cytosine-5)-methyltransferase 1